MSASTPNPPRSVPASGIRHRNISTGCSNLDAILRGGAKTKLVTELVGENGSGKTQVCLQLLLETVGGGSFGRRRRPQNRYHRRDVDDEDGEEDDGVSAVYVTTEGQFPVERLREMWRERRRIQREREKERNFGDLRMNECDDNEEDDAQRKRAEKEQDEEEEEKMLDSIYVFQAMGNAENCWEVLRSVSTVLSSAETNSSSSSSRKGGKSEKKKNGELNDDGIRRKPVKLIVIDSLTAPFREDLEEGVGGESKKDRNMQWVILRAQFLYRFTHLLKEFAWKHDLAVVVTNHVVDSFDDEDEDERCANECRVFQTSTKHQREHEEEEEKEGKEEEETDCYGKRAFPKRFFTSNRFVKPGLGLAWANCPNSSVFLSRDDTDDCGEKSLRRRRRRRADAFRSPFAEAQSCTFRIEKEGIVNDNDDDELEYS